MSLACINEGSHFHHNILEVFLILGSLLSMVGKIHNKAHKKQFNWELDLVLPSEISVKCGQFVYTSWLGSYDSRQPYIIVSPFLVTLSNILIINSNSPLTHSVYV